MADAVQYQEHDDLEARTLGENSCEVTIAANNTARDGSYVDLSKMDLDEYPRNPIITFEHGHEGSGPYKAPVMDYFVFGWTWILRS